MGLIVATIAVAIPVVAVGGQAGAISLTAPIAVRIDAQHPDGYDVAAAGDVNGDGAPDLLVGERTAGGGLWLRPIYVVYGGRGIAGLNRVILTQLGANGFAIRGASSAGLFAGLAGVGDVNADGLGDVAVDGGDGAVVFGRGTTADVELANLGSRGFRFFGGREGSLGGDYTVEPTVAAAGDVNRDGLGDFALSARLSLGGQATGVAHVVFGKGSTTPLDLGQVGAHGFRIRAAPTDAVKGVRLVGAGDVNGDGFADLLAGVLGAAYVVFGTPATGHTIDLADLGVRGYRIQLPSQLRVLPALSPAGDVNRDGRADVLIGVPAVGGEAGAAFVVLGKADEATITLDALGSQGYRIDGAVAGDLAGWSVANAGDVNRDRVPDALVGAPGADAAGKSDAGSVFVVFGQSRTPRIELAQLGTRGFRLDGSAQGEQAGDTVAGPGDVDRDGHADVLIGTRACCAYLALPRFPAILGFRKPLVGTPAAPSATLRLSINPRGFSTTAYVEWGLTSSYGQRTNTRNVGNGTVPVTYTETVSGRVAAGRTYHYRVVATNAFGATASGDLLFRIPAR